MENKRHWLVNFILYNVHYIGMGISFLLAYATYDLSDSALSQLKGTINGQERSRSILLSNITLNRAFSMVTGSLILSRPEVFILGQDLLSESYKILNTSSFARGDKYKKYVNSYSELQDYLLDLSEGMENGEGVTRKKYVGLARKLENLSVNLVSDEVFEWGRGLESNRDIIDTQSDTNNFLKYVHGIFTIVVFLLMYFAKKKKLADRLMEDSERLHRNLFKSLSEGIILLDSEGKVISFNKSTEEILKIEASRVNGRYIHELFSQCFQKDESPFPENKSPFELAVSSRDVQSGMIVGIRKLDFSMCWISLNTQPIVDFRSPDKDSIILSFADITGLIMNQKVIDQQRQKMVRTSRLSEMGEMAGGIAHEVNNPLAVISAEAEDMLEIIEDEGGIETDDIISSAERIKKTAFRISKIVKGLLNFAREGENDPFRPEKLTEIMGDTIELTGKKLTLKGVKLTLPEIDEELTIECRATQIGQVLMNLINNASDAIEEQEDKWIKVDVLDLSSQVEISITDSGSGIPKELQEKILSPFFTTKEIGKGTGLGLSVSKGLVEDHGGVLKIDKSCPNTRFIVRLPKAQKKKLKEAS